MKIDWNEAPDATHYDKRKGCIPAFMRKAADGSGWEFRQTNGGWMFYGTLTDEQVAKLKKRPAAWTGEGRPPVGTVCEHRTGPGMSWSKSKVLAYGEKKVFYQDYGGYEWSRPYDEIEFRPIRTPEQIAAEEREEAIRQMVEDTNVLTGVIADRRIMAGQLYDAGWRKQGAL